MDQKMKTTLADCYSEISDIWLSTAKIARGKLGLTLVHATHDEAEFWEAFERRCCIRAGYYARLAEQHRGPEIVIGTENVLKPLSKAQIEEWRRLWLEAIEVADKETNPARPETPRKPKGRAGGLARSKKLSPKRRSEIAKKAAIARWKAGPSVHPIATLYER